MAQENLEILHRGEAAFSRGDFALSERRRPGLESLPMKPLRKTPEEKAAKSEAKEAARAAKEAEEREAKIQQAWEEFWASPAGQARTSFRNGYQVFQYDANVMATASIPKYSVIGKATLQSNDATAVLNLVAHRS
jgi:hypothetical protein